MNYRIDIVTREMGQCHVVQKQIEQTFDKNTLLFLVEKTEIKTRENLPMNFVESSAKTKFDTIPRRARFITLTECFH